MLRGQHGEMAASTGGALSCWRVSFDALDPCGADEGTSSSNRRLMLGRTASAVGGCNRTKAAWLKVQGAAGGCHDAFETPRREEGTNTPDYLGEGAGLMDGDERMTAVGSGGELAGWLRRSGLAKVRHHGCRSLVCIVMAGRWREREREDLLCHVCKKVINDKISFDYH
jgi:hypothetical protein